VSATSLNGLAERISLRKFAAVCTKPYVQQSFTIAPLLRLKMHDAMTPHNSMLYDSSKQFLMQPTNTPHYSHELRPQPLQ
jgi:hypothetical protein